MTLEEKRNALNAQAASLLEQDMELRKALDGLQLQGQHIQKQHDEAMLALQKNQREREMLFNSLQLLKELEP